MASPGAPPGMGGGVKRGADDVATETSIAVAAHRLQRPRVEAPPAEGVDGKIKYLEDTVAKYDSFFTDIVQVVSDLQDQQKKSVEHYNELLEEKTKECSDRTDAKTAAIDQRLCVLWRLRSTTSTTPCRRWAGKSMAT